MNFGNKDNIFKIIAELKKEGQLLDKKIIEIKNEKEEDEKLKVQLYEEVNHYEYSLEESVNQISKIETRIEMALQQSQQLKHFHNQREQIAKDAVDQGKSNENEIKNDMLQVNVEVDNICVMLLQLKGFTYNKNFCRMGEYEQEYKLKKEAVEKLEEKIKYLQTKQHEIPDGQSPNVTLSHKEQLRIEYILTECKEKYQTELIQFIKEAEFIENELKILNTEE